METPKALVEEFMKGDCALSNNSSLQVFGSLYNMTGGDPCTTGCAYIEGGKCPAYQRIIVQQRIAKRRVIRSLETVKEEAQRRNISISQVRRERRG